MTQLDFTQPFTTAQARVAGLTDKQLRGAAFTRVFRGVHVSASVEQDAAVRARAALLLAPEGSGLVSLTAALLWAPVLPVPSVTHIGIPGSHRMQVSGISATRFEVLPTWVSRRSLPLTSPEETFVALATVVDLVELVAFGDALVRRQQASPESLLMVAERAVGRGVRLAREAARLVREHVDSPMETRLRLLIVLAGLPEPVVNHCVRFADGQVAYRIDLAYPDIRLAIEYDGRQHIERERQWAGDISRREDLERIGWRFVIVIAADVFVHPERTLDRIAAALRRQTTSQAWRRHFPGRSTT